jgi:hemoglobin
VEPENDRPAKRLSAMTELTGISEQMIADLVATFYARVRQDPLLSPLFRRVKDWDAHLSRLRDFWSSVVLMSGRYHGQPMVAHLSLPVDPQHFDRWLALFEQAASEVCPPAAAAHFLEKARRIADSFEIGIATQRGQIAAPRHAPARLRPARARLGYSR